MIISGMNGNTRVVLKTIHNFEFLNLLHLLPTINLTCSDNGGLKQDTRSPN